MEKDFKIKIFQELITFFTELYDKYYKMHTGVAKFFLDLLLFTVVSGVGLFALSIIFIAMSWTLSFFFDNSNKIVFWTFLVLVSLFVCSKLIEFINYKSQGVKNNEK